MRKWRVKKLSTALRQALDDMRRAERMKSKFVLDMDVLCQVEDDGKCTLCLAGSKLKLGLGGADEYSVYTIRESDTHTYAMVWAMDDLRLGRVGAALSRITNNTGHPAWGASHSLDRTMPSYGETKGSRREWWRAMRKLQRDLLRAGL